MVKLKSNGPDFLVIGAQKSATTWLYSCMRKHEGLYLPPKKEIHYFDRSTSYSSSSVLSEASPLKRYNPLTAIQALKTCFQKSSNWADFRWYIHYFFSHCNDKWYRNLFSRGQPHQVAGEVTPGYSMLSKADVAKVKQVNPHLKIIFIMRNPIERDWSAYLMRLRKHQLNYSDVNDDYVYRFFEFDGCRMKGDYLSTLLHWQAHFPKDQLFIGYYEDVKQNARQFLNQIFHFLGVDEVSQWDKYPLDRIFNKSKKLPIPERFEKYLSDKYAADLLRIYEMTKSPYVMNWYNKATSISDELNEGIQS